MPAPKKTTREAIVAAGRNLLETLGPDALTMQAVADEVGIRAPSLYKWVRNRRELMALVAEAGVEELARSIERTHGEPDPQRRLVAQANALRDFAHRWPAAYRLLFAPHVAPLSEPSQATVAPVISTISELVGTDHALDGARLLTAWATGFIAMELNGRLQLGGDIDAAWSWGLNRIVAALQH